MIKFLPTTKSTKRTTKTNKTCQGSPPPCQRPLPLQPPPRSLLPVQKRWARPRPNIPLCPSEPSRGSTALGRRTSTPSPRCPRGTLTFIIGFIVDGMLPKEGGYQCTLSKDGFPLSWSRPVDSLLFNFKQVKPILGQDYSESHA
jgi:hypothetical protein